ncbi:MAG: glucose-1-phosphate adenylyltransferase, partial [Deltaproteobacteria bacterium]
QPGGLVEDSVLLDGVQVEPGAQIRRAIVDEDVVIPPRTLIGFDAEEDKKRFTISPGGVVIVPRGIALT